MNNTESQQCIELLEYLSNNLYRLGYCFRFSATTTIWLRIECGEIEGWYWGKKTPINNMIVVIMVFNGVYDPLTHRFFFFSFLKPTEIWRAEYWQSKQLTKDTIESWTNLRNKQMNKRDSKMHGVINYCPFWKTLRSRSRWTTNNMLTQKKNYWRTKPKLRINSKMYSMQLFTTVPYFQLVNKQWNNSRKIVT